MEALLSVEYILKALGLILPVIFHGYRLFKLVRDDRKKKSEPSVQNTVIHLYYVKIFVIFLR